MPGDSAEGRLDSRATDIPPGYKRINHRPAKTHCSVHERSSKKVKSSLSVDEDEVFDAAVGYASPFATSQVKSTLQGIARSQPNLRPVWKDRDDVREQVAFYRAAASAYRRRPVDLSSGALAVAKEKLLQLAPLQHILELAPGTGDWTQELVRIGQTVTAIDASPEMIEINRERVGDPRVEYRQEDLFQWSPHQEYDLVFFAFWLSHVPPDLANAFLTKICTAVRPKGHLFIIDQCNAYEHRPEEIAEWSFSHVRWEGIFEERMLADGRTFRIVKVFYHPRLLAERVRQLGFEVTAERVGERLFNLSGTRLRPSRSA